MKKKIVAVLLSALMAFSLVPTAFAEETGKNEENTSTVGAVTEEEPTLEQGSESVSDPTAESKDGQDEKKQEQKDLEVKEEEISLLSESSEDNSIVASGECGENASWTLDSDGKLTISGAGEMTNYLFDEAPWDRDAVKSVEIQEGITSIGRWAFWECDSLTSITIPDGVTSIGEYAFCDCSSLTSITIPANVTSIGESTFEGCSGLTSITIPDGVTSIGEYAFCACSRLTSITIPDGVTSIEKFAFEGCSGLTSIIIPDGVTSIREYAFCDCSSLTSITIPSSVTWVANNAFFYCENVEDIYFNGTEKEWDKISSDILESLGTTPTVHIMVEIVDSGECGENLKWTLDSNGKLTISGTGEMTDSSWERKAVKTVEIQNGVNTIGNFAFCNCSNLTSITIPVSVTSIGVAAFSMSGLTSIVIPDSVTSIGDDAFSISGLTSIVIPDSVTSIGEFAFEGCSKLTSATIPCRFKDKIGFSWFWGTSVKEPTLHHNYQVTKEAKTASCTEDGNTEEQTCSGCGNKIGGEVIDATGHTYGNVSYTWSEDNQSCKAERKCTAGDKVESEQATIKTEVVQKQSCTLPEKTKYRATFENSAFEDQEKVVETAKATGHDLEKVAKKDATCTESGYKEYWQCKTCGALFSDETGTKGIEKPDKIDATGHSFGEAIYTWSDDNKSCTAERKCTAGDKADNVTAKSTAQVIQKKNCTLPEITKYTVTFDGDVFKPQTKEVETAKATGHSLKKIEKQEATAAKEGNIIYWYCEDCGKYFSDEKAEKEIKQADTVVAKLAPVIIKGDGASVTVGEKKELSFTSDAAYDDFIRVEVDGKTLDTANYTVKAGSTIVTLKADYVASLAEGEHSLGIVSESGTATAHFTVSKKKAETVAKTSGTSGTAKPTAASANKTNTGKSSPKTGDSADMQMYLILMLAAIGGIAGVSVKKKAKK